MHYFICIQSKSLMRNQCWKSLILMVAPWCKKCSETFQAMSNISNHAAFYNICILLNNFYLECAHRNWLLYRSEAVWLSVPYSYYRLQSMHGTWRACRNENSSTIFSENDRRLLNYFLLWVLYDSGPKGLLYEYIYERFEQSTWYCKPDNGFVNSSLLQKTLVL